MCDSTDTGDSAASRKSAARRIQGAIALGLLALGCAAVAHSDETRIRLKEAPQAALVRARCTICHSADYIPMNSPFMNKAGWDAEVRKMIKVMGAPISDAEAAEIVNYLAVQYGTE